LNIKGIETGKNVPFRAIRDILRHKKEQNKARESVGVSILMLYNGEMYDLFTEQKKRGKLRFEENTNEVLGSQTCQQEF
jgi:hypothetical protein